LYGIDSVPSESHILNITEDRDQINTTIRGGVRNSVRTQIWNKYNEYWDQGM